MLTARAQQWRRFFGKLDLLFHPQGLLEKGLEADLAGRRPEGEALEEAGFPLPDDSPTEPWILCWPLKLGGRPFVLRSLKFRDRAHSRFVIDCRGHSKLCMTGRRVGVVRHKEGWAMPPNVEVFAVPLTEVAGTDVSRSTLRIHSQADSRIDISWTTDPSAALAEMSGAAAAFGSSEDPAGRLMAEIASRGSYASPPGGANDGGFEEAMGLFGADLRVGAQ